MDSDDQNSGVTMACMTGSDNGTTERFYGRVEESWELDYFGLHNKIGRASCRERV